MKNLASRFLLLNALVFGLLAPSTTVHAAGVLYAKPGGTSDCSNWVSACTLQIALTNALSGDEIWAAAGTYKPTEGTDPDATFQLIEGVAIYGGFAGTETGRDQRNPTLNVTILSGEIGPGDNSYHVVTGANNTILDGFTITAGGASGGGSNETEYGGGMYNYYSSPTLTNITFTNNWAYWVGGGMYSVSGSPTLTNVTFTNNWVTHYGGGGMYNESGHPTLSDVTFNTNSATSDGGGMYNFSSNLTMMNVTFSGNSASGKGGGMFNVLGSPALTNVNFSANTASTGGGLYYESGSSMVTNVIFSGNSANVEGGGMFNLSNPTLTDVTFSANTAGNKGGGMYNYNLSGSPTLTNVTFSDNTASGTSDPDGGGGMYNHYSSPALTNVTFTDNLAHWRGGGMHNHYSSPTLTNVTFNRNESPTGGGMYNYSSSSTLTNVTFNSNTASGISLYDGGGGMDNRFSNPTLTGVTFTANLADLNGGGMNNFDSNPQIRNTIFWGNTTGSGGAQIYNIVSSVPIVSDSVIQDGCPAGSSCAAIITADPLLGKLGNYGGFTQTVPLLAGSSAIDVGNDAACAATDQRGVARPQGPHCDIGAYEYTDTLVPKVSSSTRINPNPTNAFSVSFTVTFSEPVTGVDVSDFALTQTGAISGDSVTGVSGVSGSSGSTYTVTINTGSGIGTIRLDVVDNDTIMDLSFNPLGGVGAGNGNYTGGETYNVRFYSTYLSLVHK